MCGSLATASRHVGSVTPKPSSMASERKNPGVSATEVIPYGLRSFARTTPSRRTPALTTS